MDFTLDSDGSLLVDSVVGVWDSVEEIEDFTLESEDEDGGLDLRETPKLDPSEDLGSLGPWTSLSTVDGDVDGLSRSPLFGVNSLAGVRVEEFVNVPSTIREAEFNVGSPSSTNASATAKSDDTASGLASMISLKSIVLVDASASEEVDDDRRGDSGGARPIPRTGFLRGLTITGLNDDSR